MSRHRRSRAPETRTDAVDTGVATILANFLTGSGDADDVNSAWSPLLGGRELWPQELERLSETWIGQLAIETKPRWLWTAGVRLDLDGDLRPSAKRAAAIKARTDIDDARKASLLKGGRALVEQHMIDLGARDAVREAHEHALQMGGGGILVRTYPQAPLHLPLDMTGRVVCGLVPMSGYHLRVTELGTNPLGARYQRPSRYTIDHTGTSAEWWAGDVHWSHVLDFMGPRRRVPELSWVSGWSQWPAISILQTAWDAIRSFVAAGLNAEDAARRLSVFVIKHPDYAAKIANNPGSFQDLLTTITQKLSTRATYHAPPGGDVNTASLGLSGMDGINRFFQEQLPLALGGIPYALVFDAAGSGLSKDTLVWDSWTTRLTGDASACGEIAAYTRLYGLIAPDVYANPPALRKVEPGDFLQPTDADRMALRVQGATEAAAVIAAGIAPPEAFEEARYQGTFNTDISVQEGWRAAAPPAQAPEATEPATDADPIDSPEEIPDDTSAAVFAEQMTSHGFAQCEHGKKNRCRICGIERDRSVQAGPDGQPVYAVKWRAIGSIRADADFSGTSYLWLPVPEQERVATVQRAVDALVPLEGYGPGDPMPSLYHVTALHLGETSQTRARGVQARAPLALGAPIALRPRRVLAFPAQPDGRSPVVIEIESAEVAALHERLRQALAPLPPDEYVPFVAHVTLGFARLPADLDLSTIPVPADLGESAELRFTFDGRDTVWPL